MVGLDEGIQDRKKKEKRAAEIEAKLDRDTNDLISHIKCVTTETNGLRDRVRAAESVISDLKSSGESSVEQLMETLYLMKVRQEELDAQAQTMREVIQAKEVVLKSKEEHKAAIKQTIEIENAARENEIHALRVQLNEQKQLLEGQRRLLNELQVLCELTSADIVRATRDLERKTKLTNQLTLDYQEVDQSMVTLKANVNN